MADGNIYFIYLYAHQFTNFGDYLIGIFSMAAIFGEWDALNLRHSLREYCSMSFNSACIRYTLPSNDCIADFRILFSAVISFCTSLCLDNVFIASSYLAFARSRNLLVSSSCPLSSLTSLLIGANFSSRIDFRSFTVIYFESMGRILL